MDNLLNLIKSQINDSTIDQLSQYTDGSREQTQDAAMSTVSTLLAALQKNAKDPQKAEQLNNALERDHDGSLLNSFSSVVLGQQDAQNSKAADGAGIVKHILGNNSDGAIQMISKLSGLGESSSGKMLISLAPLVMGALGKTKKEQNVSSSGLSDLLGSAVNKAQSDNPKMDLITRFLDSDGDGSVLDDLGSIGMKIASSFFGNKK